MGGGAVMPAADEDAALGGQVAQLPHGTVAVLELRPCEVHQVGGTQPRLRLQPQAHLPQLPRPADRQRHRRLPPARPLPAVGTCPAYTTPSREVDSDQHLRLHSRTIASQHIL